MPAPSSSRSGGAGPAAHAPTLTGATNGDRLAFAAVQSVVSDARNNINNIRSEEDAKLQIITRMLTEVLAWSHSDISSESHNENGFSDYVISDRGQNAFVIEAKKVGEIDLDTSTTRKSTYKISGPVLRRAIIGIKQAASYCVSVGI